MKNKNIVFSFVLLSVFHFSSVCADGVLIDKIYDPYVELHERELEVRSSFYNYNDGRPDYSIHRVGVGYGVTDNVFVEGYLSGEKAQNQSLDIEAYELEVKWQLTEQGEYTFDWGLLFELENRKDLDIFEVSSTVINVYEFDRWSLTTNASLIYEWGSDVDEEFETALGMQLRYRQQPELEYGLELYTGQDTRGLGPVLMGTQRFSGRKKMTWELGAIFGIEPGENAATPNVTLRGLIEFEF